jgi:lysozyme
MDDLTKLVCTKLVEKLVWKFEGLYLHPYLCPNGVPTVGLGATYYQNGKSVKLTDPPLTTEQAVELFRWMVATVYLPAVLKLCPSVADPSRLAALVDFTYNLGAGQLSSSTLRRKVNAGDWAAVPGELRKWSKAGGRTLKGLVLRREAEISLLP